MRVLVTGSSGFIGTAVVNRLIESGHEVLGIDRKTPKPDTAEHEFVQSDILDTDQIDRCFADFGPHALIHLAAHMSLREDGSSERYKANTVGTRNLIEASRSTPATKRAIFTSTKYVFRGGQPAHERDFNPDSTYGRSKVEMEEMIWETDGGGTEWCIARPTTIWGPGMSPHYQNFLRMVGNGKYVHIGSRPVRKHMGFVGNVAVQYEKLVTVDAAKIHQQVFYLTDYEAEILSEWTEAFRQALGGPKIRTIPKSLAVLGGKVGDLITKLGKRKFPLTSFRVKNLTTDDVCDPGATAEVCGEMPFGLAEGAQITADWYRSLNK